MSIIIWNMQDEDNKKKNMDRKDDMDSDKAGHEGGTGTSDDTDTDMNLTDESNEGV